MSGLRDSGPAVGLALLGAIYWLGVYQPLAGRAEAARSAYETARAQQKSSRRLLELDRELAPFLEQQLEGQNLLSRVEQRLQALGLRDRAVQMRSTAPRKDEDGKVRARDAAVLRLQRLDLKQLTAILEDLDRLPRDVWVRKLNLALQGDREAQVELELEELQTGAP